MKRASESIGARYQSNDIHRAVLTRHSAIVALDCCGFALGARPCRTGPTPLAVGHSSEPAVLLSPARTPRCCVEVYQRLPLNLVVAVGWQTGATAARPVGAAFGGQAQQAAEGSGGPGRLR